MYTLRYFYVFLSCFLFVHHYLLVQTTCVRLSFIFPPFQFDSQYMYDLCRERVKTGFIRRDRAVVFGAFVPQRRGRCLWHVIDGHCCVHIDLGQCVV